MQALDKLIKDKRVLVFFDLEGTQYTSEMIEIGAYACLIRDDYSIKKIDKVFKSYVWCNNPVGPIVRKMTGITDKLLREEGRSFADVMASFRKYLGKYWGKCKFVAFGNHDMHIIEETYFGNDDADIAIEREIKKNYIDFSAFISTYIKDEKGNPLSLKHYLDLFKLDFEGQQHDAAADAYNLAMLYQAFLDNKELVKERYKMTLAMTHHLPSPIAQALKYLTSNETITPEDWDRIVKESLK